jgi:hypothetical protein
MKKKNKEEVREMADGEGKLFFKVFLDHAMGFGRFGRIKIYGGRTRTTF